MITQTPITTSKKVALTVTLPTVNIEALVFRAKTFFLTLFSSIYNPVSGNVSRAALGATSRAKRLKMPNMKERFHFDKKHIKLAFPVLIGIIIIVGIVFLVRSLPDAQSRPASESSQVVSPDTLATTNLDKKFIFPLKDEKGKEVGNFDYVIQSANIQKQIVVQGQRATAVKGRVFLVLNLKITNNLKQTIKLNTRDYLRMVVASNSEEKLAADIHNDPVEVQAISTKYTRVGIALNEEDAKKPIQLSVGEIDGEKQTIALNFKY